MRKLLLSTIALMMSVAMMAIGAGDGTTKANAIDFDWANGNIHEASQALWYNVDLQPLDEAAEPTLVLYLTNLDEEVATVDVTVSLSGSQRTATYTIAPKGNYRLDLPIAQYREFITVDEVSMALQSDQKIVLAAKVYEFDEYVKEAVANSEPVDWNSGVKQEALSTKWYKVDITSLKRDKQHLQFTFSNHANHQALVAATFVLDDQHVSLPLAVPAGFSTTKVIDYQLLAALPDKVSSVHVGVTTDSPLEVATAPFSAIAEDPTPCLNAISPEHGVEYVHPAGETKWYKLSLNLLKTQDDYSSLYLANKSGKTAHVTIGAVIDCQYTTGTKVTIPIPAQVNLGVVAPNFLRYLMEELTRFERVYNRVEAADVYLEIKSDQEIGFGLDVENQTTSPCLRNDLITFDWNKGAKLDAHTTKWYEMDITSLKQNKQQVKLTFTNHADSIAWVATVVSLDCPAKLTMPLIVPVPAGMSVDKVIDYSFFAASPIEQLYIGVHADSQIELAAKAESAVITPAADCVNAVDVQSGVKYVHKAGTTWYNFSEDLMDGMGKAVKFTFKNLSPNHVRLTAGVTVGCEYNIATRGKLIIPGHILGKPLHSREFALTVPSRVLTIARKLVDADVKEFYLELTTDNPIEFSIDMDAPTGCETAIPFPWDDCFELKANEDAWFDVNISEPLNSAKPISVTFHNNNNFPVEIEAEVSPTCPTLFSLTEHYTVAANTSKQVRISPATVQELLKEYGEYVDGMNCYARFNANGNLTVCVNDTLDAPLYPCSSAVELDWEKGVKLSQLPTGWYLLDVTKIHAEKKAFQVHIINDLDTVVSMSADLYDGCDEDVEDNFMMGEGPQDFAAGFDKTKTVSYDDFVSVVPEYLNELYVYVTSSVSPTPECKDVYNTINAEFCESFEWNGLVYHNPGKYVQIFELATGCDSIVTLNLNQVCPPNPDCVPVYGPTTYATFCGEYKWYDQVLTVADTYTKTLTAVNGCDSIITLVLTEDCPIDQCEDVYTSVKATFCESIVWNGMTITEAGTYTKTLSKTDGCDSIVTLTLTEECAPTPDCEHAILLDWRNGVKLSQLSAGWYKLYVVDVHENQESVTAKVINDLKCEATVTALGYAHCEDEDALYEAAQPFKLGESSKTVSYADFVSVVPSYVEYIYVNIISIVENCDTPDPCADYVELDWRNGVKLSQLQDGGKYKLYVADVHANQESVTAKVINDLKCEATVTAFGYAHCEDEEALYEGAQPFKLGESSKTVSYADFVSVVPSYVEYIYVNNISIVENCDTIIDHPDPCADYVELDWRNGVKLSQLQDGGKYKLDVAAVHENQEDIVVLILNDLECTATVTADAYAHCEDDEALNENGAMTFKVGQYTKNLDYATFVQFVPKHVDTLYVNINSIIVENCDCADYVELDWRNGVKLSQLQNGGKYKLYVADVHENQESVTAKVINDLECEATVTAFGYAHCEDEEALYEGAQPFKLGESSKTVSYADFVSVVPSYVEYIYVNNISIVENCDPPTPDCEHAILLDWRNVKLSDLKEGNWYKLDFSDVQANQLNPVFKATNDLEGDATVSAAAYFHCEDAEAMGETTKKLVKGHVGEREVSYDDFYATFGKADVLYVQVTKIKVDPDPCANVEELDWENGIKLSQLKAGHMYKLDLSNVQAAQTAFSVKAENDLGYKACVSAVAYSYCEANEDNFLVEATKQLAADYTAETMVSYADLYGAVGYATEVYVVVTKIENCDPIPDCEHAILLDWSNVLLSQLVEGKWYKLDFSDVQANQLNPVFKATNDLDGDATVSAAAYFHCEDAEAMGETTKKLVKGHVGEREVSYDDFYAAFGKADVLYVQVTDITVVEEITDFVCDGTKYEDINGEAHIITSKVPSANTWTTVKDGVEYTYQITPIVAPDTLTKEKLAEIGALPTVKAGEAPNVEGTVETIVAYFAANDNKAIADVTKVEWEAAGLVTTECDATLHTLTLVVESECDNLQTVVIELDVDPVPPGDSVTVVVCTPYEWNGKTYTESGVYVIETACSKQVLNLTVSDFGTNTPEHDSSFDNKQAVAKYGDRMLLLNAKALSEEYAAPTAANVAWYKVVNGLDNSEVALAKAGDDEFVANGLYIDSKEGFEGQYYALIVQRNADDCDYLMRTQVLNLGNAANAPKLAPTVARPNEELHLFNLNPANVTEVRVFNTSGELMATYNAEQATEFVFQAATLPGYYMVEVQSNGDQITLRYIVK